MDLGESHRDAVIREVDEELRATIRDLELLGTVENIFRIDGVLGHEIVSSTRDGWSLSQFARAPL